MVKIDGEDAQPSPLQLDLKEAMSVFANMMKAQQEQNARLHSEQLNFLNEIRGQQMKFEQQAIIAQEQNQEFMSNIADYLDFSASVMHSIEATLNAWMKQNQSEPTQVCGKRSMPFDSPPSAQFEATHPPVTPQPPSKRANSSAAHRTCYNCQQLGHIYRNCPTLIKPQEPSPVMPEVSPYTFHQNNWPQNQDSTDTSGKVESSPTRPYRVVCTFCGIQGHNLASCPSTWKPPPPVFGNLNAHASKGASKKFCAICQQIGHRTRSCFFKGMPPK